jgi:protein-disulfide isomerase
MKTSTLLTVAVLAAAASVPAIASAQRAPARVAVQRDVVTRIDDGYTLGNPKAPLKLTVVSSFGCIHCANLENQGMAALRRDWVNTGKVQLRFVPFVMFPTDMAAITLADCGPTSGFFRRSAAIFARRDVTERSARALDRASVLRLRTAPMAEQNAIIVKGSRLNEGYQAMGMTPAQASACLSSATLRAAVDKRQKLADTRYNPAGTPTVLLNGRKIASSWSGIEQELRNALPR